MIADRRYAEDRWRNVVRVLNVHRHRDTASMTPLVRVDDLSLLRDVLDELPVTDATVRLRSAVGVALGEDVAEGCVSCGTVHNAVWNDGLCWTCVERDVVLDRESSVSRQHYIDTGRYLSVRT